MWIPAVAAQRWLVISRDSRMAQHRAEIDAVRAHNARVVTLSGKEAGGTVRELSLDA